MNRTLIAMNTMNSMLCVCLSSIVLASCGGGSSGGDGIFYGVDSKDLGNDSTSQAPPKLTTPDTLVDSQTPGTSPDTSGTELVNGVAVEEFKSVDCISADITGYRFASVGHAIVDMQLNNDSGSTTNLAPCEVIGVVMLGKIFGQL